MPKVRRHSPRIWRWETASFFGRIVVSLDRKCLGHTIGAKPGIFDKETRRKPLAFAADAASYGDWWLFWYPLVRQGGCQRTGRIGLLGASEPMSDRCWPVAVPLRGATPTNLRRVARKRGSGKRPRITAGTQPAKIARACARHRHIGELTPWRAQKP